MNSLTYLRTALRKFLAIFFLLGFLSSPSCFGELLKVPVLLHHYFEHHQPVDGMSLIDFFNEHYGEMQHEHQGQHEHDQLPFKQVGGSQVCSALIPDHTLVPEGPAAFSDFKDSPKATPYHSLYDFMNHTTVWQPPRIFCSCAVDLLHV